MVSLSEKRAKKPTKVPYLNIGPEKSVEITILADPVDWTYTVEHSSPDSWYKTALCTYADDGMCYACEQKKRPWNAKNRVYIPVIHQGQVKVFATGMGKNSAIHSLQKAFAELGSIKGHDFVISRNGAGKRSKYTAYHVDKEEPLVYNGRVNMGALLKAIAYNEQPEYYK